MDKKVIIVDVDSTMYDFLTPLYQKLRVIKPDVTHPMAVNTWGKYIEEVGSKEFYRIVNQIHEEIRLLEPFRGIKPLLDLFWCEGYTIVVATHRLPTLKQSLVEWLDHHQIHYDGIFCDTSKKTDLFNEETYLVIDDCPATIRTAIEKGIPVWTIRYNYNLGFSPRRVGYFENAQAMFTFAMGHWPQPGIIPFKKQGGNN